MKQLEIPRELQKNVQEFVVYTQGTKYEQEQQKSFINMISPSLATKVSVMIFSSSIQKSSMFRKIFQNKQKLMQSQMESGNSQKIDNQEIVSLMIEKFQTKLVEPENVICQQFDESDSFYLVAKGTCQAYIKDEKKIIREGDKITPGEFFGEISLVYGCKRTATVKAVKYSTLAVLTKKDYKEHVVLEFEDIAAEFKKKIYLYDDRMNLFIKKSI